MGCRWRGWIVVIILLLQGCGSGGDSPASGTDGGQSPFDSPSVLLLNLGDSLTNGVQSARVHEFTQPHGFAALLATQLGVSADLVWSNPLLSLDSGVRIDPVTVPTNLGVSGATVQSLLQEQTGSGNPLLDSLMAPVPSLAGRTVSQLEAAEFVADLHNSSQTLITLWIGNNDVLGAVTASGGTALRLPDISVFLGDVSSGRDAATLEANLDEIVRRLGLIPGARIFIANLPRVARIGFLFDREDIGRLSGLAALPLQPRGGEALGFAPFVAAVAPALDQDALTLNLATAVSASVDGNLLDRFEAAILDARVASINAHIATLAERENVHLVDIAALFESVQRGEIQVGGRILRKTFGAGGLFSLDGVHPSHTGHALIANAFIERIASALQIVIPPVSLETVMAADPYIDVDRDGFAPGPGGAFVDPLLLPLADCNDADPALSAPAVIRGPCP